MKILNCLQFSETVCKCYQLCIGVTFKALHFELGKVFTGYAGWWITYQQHMCGLWTRRRIPGGGAGVEDIRTIDRYVFDFDGI